MFIWKLFVYQIQRDCYDSYLWKKVRTSSPISPPTGIVMRTTCEYNPVHSTRRNSADSDGKAFVMLGKYCISCLGGPEAMFESFLNSIADLERVLLVGMDLKDVYAEWRRTRQRLDESIDDGASEYVQLGKGCSHDWLRTVTSMLAVA